MRKTFLFSLLAMLGLAGSIFGQEPPVDRLTVAFSDPLRPGTLRASLMNGGMTIKAYEGKEVLIEARIRPERESRHERTDKKKMGMRRLEIASTGLTVEEEDNVMRVGAETMNRTIDLMIQVPKKIALKLSCLNDGDIKVDGVTGEIEVNNQNGAIALTNVSGSVVAYAHNDDITVSFVKIEPEKTMSFVSWNGDVDVTFPPEMRAKTKMKTTQGDVYSDFEIKLEASANRVEEDGRKDGGKYKLKVEKAIHGLINGGGPEMQFSTYNGDIYIRTGK